MEGPEIRMGFPPYRRSHLRSHTYHTLVCILSHLFASSTPLHSPTHHLQISIMEVVEWKHRSAASTSSIKHDSRQKEMESVKSVCAAMGSLPTTEALEFEKEEQYGQKVAEAMHHSFDVDVNMCEDDGLLDSAILEDKHEMWNEEVRLETLICANNATNSSNNPIEKEDIEEGEISGDFGMDGNSFDMSFVDSLILQQKNIDEVQKPKTVVENIIFPCKIRNSEKEEGYESNSFIVNALQDNSEQVEPSTSDKNGIACGVEIATSRATIECDKAGKCGSMLKPENSKDTHIGSKRVADLPTNFAQNQVLHRGLLEVEASKDHGSSSAVKKVDVSSKKKRGPSFEEKKAKKKLKQRKKRAEINRQLGVKRLKLPPPPIQKPKTITYCRHYRYGRCHERNKCHFSHDTEPLTKSKPCCHFARRSCMKGDDCPFDHQLSKYSCTNFVSGGSCSRGDACMFSHQVMPVSMTPIIHVLFSLLLCCFSRLNLVTRFSSMKQLVELDPYCASGQILQ